MNQACESTLVWSDGNAPGPPDDWAIGVGTSPNGVTYNDPVGYEIVFSVGNGTLTIGDDGDTPTAVQSDSLPPEGPDAGGTRGDHGADGDQSGSGAPMHGDIVSNYTGEGVVHITPGRDTDPPVARDNCVDRVGLTTDVFEVAGFFAMSRGVPGVDPPTFRGDLEIK